MVITEIGSKLKNFSLNGIDKKSYSPGFYHDKKIFVIVLISADKYGQHYSSRLNNINNKYPAGIFGLSPETSVSSLERLNLNFPILVDEDKKVIRMIDGVWTPEVFVFDSQRKLVYRGKIDDCWYDENKVKKNYLELVLKSLMSGKNVCAMTHPGGVPIP